MIGARLGRDWGTLPPLAVWHKGTGSEWLTESSPVNPKAVWRDIILAVRNAPFEDRVVDMGSRKRRLWLYVVLAIVAIALLFGSQLLGIYIDALWFESLGYSNVYWYQINTSGLLFLVFFVITFLIVRLPFFLLNRLLPQLTERPRVRLTSVEDVREINLLPLIYRPGVWVLALVMAFFQALSLSRAWSEFALYSNSTPSGTVDPVFQKDITFYLFTLPVWNHLVDWLLTIATILFLVVTGCAVYVWYIERVRGFLTNDITRRVVAAVSAAGAFLCAAMALSTYLGRYDLLTRTQSIFTGAGYTDINVRLPALMILAFVLGIGVVVLIVNAVAFRRAKIIVSFAILAVVTWILGLGVIPQSVYSFSVKPNELAKETPYIQHNIEMTRRALGIDRFEERPFQPTLRATSEQIEASRPTLENTRLWDRGVLRSALTQLQAIRNYYAFQVPDVDRYVINGRQREVMLAAREMNVEELPVGSRNWINQHIVYTHGYGVTMNTVNEFTPEGMPHLILRDMPVMSEAPEIKVTRPEIYFGERTVSHVYVKTRPQGDTPPEFSYPASGDEGSYTTYEGSAGIEVGGMLRQLALSIYLGDGTNLLFSDYIDSRSRVLLRRHIGERVRRIAPFLLFDDDPYIVISGEGKLFWMIDAFTHSSRYPYSAGYRVGNQQVNYIRNSVKVVVDAYDGTISFWVFEPEDPIIQAYGRVFPGLFRPRAEMPEDLIAHIRYPTLLMDIQSQAYTVYHVQNPQTFYNHEDQWAIARAGAPSDQQGVEPEAMHPYHVLMQLPGETALEFANILPFTPAGEGRNNLIGWIAARSDGQNYGEMLVFSFPKNITVTGPANIRARVNQDATLSQQMTLWDQKGSKLIRGNLLVIPIADSLLYVEPFFLQAQNSPLPELRLVVIATQERLGFGDTFEKALAALMPELGTRSVQPKEAQETARTQSPVQPVTGQPAAPSTTPGASAPLEQARRLLEEYERLTSAGRHREAGEKLDQLKQLLNRGGS